MKKFTGLLLSVLIVCAMIPFTASATSGITYLNKTVKDDKVITEEKTISSAISITTSDTKWGAENQESWYVLDRDITLSNRPVVTGTVNLILTNGKTLTAPEGITLENKNSLIVYAQSDNENVMGKLTAQSSDGSAALGGLCGKNGESVAPINKPSEPGQNWNGTSGEPGHNCGTLNWNGGILTLTAENSTCLGGGTGGAGGTADLYGIGGNGGLGGAGGSVTFCGGIAFLNGKSGIGGGIGGRGGSACYAVDAGVPAMPSLGGDGGSLTVYAGKLSIHSSSGVCFGGGQGGTGGDLAMESHGGNGGRGGAGGTVTIKGGSVIFQSDSVSCIGGGAGGIGGDGGVRKGDSGSDGNAASIIIDNNPAMTGGDTEQSAIAITGYNGEKYLNITYHMSKASFAIAQGNWWLVGIGVLVILGGIVASIIIVKKKKKKISSANHKKSTKESEE